MDSKINKSERQKKRRLGTGDEERERLGKRKGKGEKRQQFFYSRTKNKPWEVYISLTFTIIIITTAIIITLTTIIIVQIIIIINKKSIRPLVSHKDKLNIFFILFLIFFKDHWTVVCSALHLYRLIFCVSIVAS